LNLRHHQILKTLIFVVSLILTFASLKVGIFWDNITFISDMGNALYENGIFNWMSITPDIDPGHPPFMAMLMALSWSAFGKALWVSHLVMLPFVYGVLFQLYKTVAYFVNNHRLRLAAFLVVIIDPTLLAQLVSVNPEVPMLFFFFLALNGVLYKKASLKLIGLLFLGIVSYRGMMLGVGICIIDVLLHVTHDKKQVSTFFNVKNILVYVLSSIPALCYISWRLLYKGWLISNPLTPWGSATDYTDESGFLMNFIRNVAVLGHRYLDFGRVFIFLAIIFICIRYWNKISTSKIKALFIIAVGSTSILILTSVFINNPMGHRYFIPSYLGFSLLVAVLLRQLYLTRTYTAKAIYVLLVMGLLSGNFWVYPDKISQGWDASLAHIHYFGLRHKAIAYLDANGIKIENTASFFPNNTSIDAVDLNGDTRQFLDFTGKEQFVLYSNVFNIKDKDYYKLKNDYLLLKSYQQFGVRIEVLVKP